MQPRDNAHVSLELLEGAAGYAVYGSDGRRLGTVIELVTEGEERGDFVAIRSERLFLWRRRVVPRAAVARVDPKDRAVMLLLDATGIERAHEHRTEELREGWVADRIPRYTDAPSGDPEVSAADADAAGEPPEPEESYPLASAAPGDGVPLVETEPVEEDARESHVLFVPTGGGYVFIERDGVPPRCAETLALSDPPGSFVVVKHAQSPLPNDQRLCAYLDRLD